MVRGAAGSGALRCLTPPERGERAGGQSGLLESSRPASPCPALSSLTGVRVCAPRGVSRGWLRRARPPPSLPLQLCTQRQPTPVCTPVSQPALRWRAPPAAPPGILHPASHPGGTPPWPAACGAGRGGGQGATAWGAAGQAGSAACLPGWAARAGGGAASRHAPRVDGLEGGGPPGADLPQRLAQRRLPQLVQGQHRLALGAQLDQHHLPEGGGWGWGWGWG